MDSLLTLAFTFILLFGYLQDREKRKVSDFIPALAMMITAFAGLGTMALFFMGLAIAVNTVSFVRFGKEVMSWSDILMMPSVLAWCFALSGVPGIFIFCLSVFLVVDVFHYSAAYAAFALAFILCFFLTDVVYWVLVIYLERLKPTMVAYDLL